MSKRVCVIMSTYNGERYLMEQIESILSQVGVNISLLIRDDGSHDNTTQILEEVAEKDSRIRWYRGTNIGFEHSFMDAALRCTGYDYYAFSDQDDVWKKDRILDAIEKIENCDADYPCLYGSNFYVTDSKLENKKSLYSDTEYKFILKQMEKYGAIAENMYACTMIWNDAMQQLLRMHKPECKVSHDVYMQLLAEYIGAKIIFDENRTIYHRIHQSNTAGIASSLGERVKKSIKIYIKSGISKKYQVLTEVDNTYSNVKLNRKNSIQQIQNQVMLYPNSVKNRIALIFSSCFRNKPIQRQLFNAFLVFTNNY